MKHSKPEDLFRAEKERALTSRDSQHARLLAEAKAAFDKLMAEGQAARKSGRPRKHPLPPLKTTSSRTPPLPMPAQPAKPVAATPAPAAVAAPALAPKQAKAVKPAKVVKAKPTAKRVNKPAGTRAKAKSKKR
ncbi:MAG: hypothetical protein ACRENU_02575 [Gemmatimonadaceae bacterium]